MSSGLKSHSQSTPAGASTIVDKSQAKQLVADAAVSNSDISLASQHPASDKSVEPFVGLAVLQKGGDFVRFEYQPRPLADDDIEVDIHFCGICGSDLHTFDSGWGTAKYPVITGHEIVGRVSKVGAKVSRLSVGQIVGVGAEVLACRQCDDCKHGDDAYCNKKIFTYNSLYPDGQWAFGGYQNKVRVNNEWAFVIPEGMDPAAASPLLCAGVTVFAPLRRHFKTGMHVGVVGVGGLGHLALQYASKIGAASVTAISSSPRKKDDAIKLGATNFLVSSDHSAMAAARHSLDLIIMTVTITLHIFSSRRLRHTCNDFKCIHVRASDVCAW